MIAFQPLSAALPIHALTPGPVYMAIKLSLMCATTILNVSPDAASKVSAIIFLSATHSVSQIKIVLERQF